MAGARTRALPRGGHAGPLRADATTRCEHHHAFISEIAEVKSPSSDQVAAEFIAHAEV